MQRSIVVTAADGLHARPAALLARLARDHPGGIRITADGRVVEAASILATMGLALAEGVEVVLEAGGPGAGAALDAAAAILSPGA